MAKYQTRPSIVEATLWDGSPAAAAEILGTVKPRHFAVDLDNSGAATVSMQLTATSATETVLPGQYVVTDTTATTIVLGPQFEAMFEPVPTAVASAA